MTSAPSLLNRDMLADRRLLLTLYIALCAAVTAGILFFSHGHFAYVLDDTYIYLALAENLPGTISINAAGQEAGAPASSILYPYLLMPFMHTSLALYVPLLINLVTGWALLLQLDTLAQRLQLFTTLRAKTRAVIVLCGAILLNLVLLIFCGMEHTLHVLTAALILLGLLDLSETPARAPTRWFWLAIILGPLLRYEALALSLLAALYAGLRGKHWPALGCAFLACLGPVLFGFYLHSQGFSWLPSSVLSKSNALTSASEGLTLAGFVFQLAGNAVDNLARYPTAWIHLALTFALAFLLLWRHAPAPQRVLVAVILCASIAHLVLGKFGWWGRYHIYILLLQLATLYYVARPLLPRLKLIVIATLLAASSSSIFYSVQVPAAAGQIYRNHGLLNIFLTEYWQDDVAAYDVGYIAWRNPHEVFDLFGLASERVRRLIRTPFARQIIPQLLAQKQINLLIAQADFADYYWQPQWQHFAELHLDGTRKTTTTRQVFFLLNPARAEELREKLKAFESRLPADVRLHWPG